MADLTPREEAALQSVIKEALAKPERFTDREPGEQIPAWQARAVPSALAALGWTISRPQKPGNAVGDDAELDSILTDVYACTRGWEAWEYGTMTEDDFTLATATDLREDLIAWRDAAVARGADR